MRSVFLTASLEFWWDDKYKIWRVLWVDGTGKALSGMAKIDTMAPLDAWMRREIGKAAAEVMYADLAAEWRD